MAGWMSPFPAMILHQLLMLMDELMQLAAEVTILLEVTDGEK